MRYRLAIVDMLVVELEIHVPGNLGERFKNVQANTLTDILAQFYTNMKIFNQSL